MNKIPVELILVETKRAEERRANRLIREIKLVPAKKRR
jgi:hypothetical protein